MAAIRIFISSVQKEFSEERKALVKYIREDVLLCKFFQPFIFEELPAINLSAPEAYLYEVAHSDIYLEKKISDFVALARTKRGFKLDYTGDNTLAILIALNLATEAGRITNAALLLFAKNPQRQRDLSCSISMRKSGQSTGSVNPILAVPAFLAG